MTCKFSTTQRAKRVRTRKIADLLAETYPDANCALPTETPLHVLIATILSSQCTDAKVNEVSPQLFKKYRSAKAFANARQAEIEKIIRPLGLYRNKAKNIIACCRELGKQYGGRVPDEIKELVTLPGVGRKTANCVLVNAFAKPGLMTDTHFCRITQRMGLTAEKEPIRIEAELAKLLPAERWGSFSHQIIIHGRRCCTARSPDCTRCRILRHCEFGLQQHIPARRA
ncbi:MAG: endonuclease III [Planctomycetes bacterium]|nr:endonuclease III [Planctomycetota bacterium]